MNQMPAVGCCSALPAVQADYTLEVKIQPKRFINQNSNIPALA